MAHPLTQQPPSSLPFAFAARPSPLAFGFGLPSTSSSSSSVLNTPNKASTTTWPTFSSSPSKVTASRLRLNPSPNVTHTSLKRSRQSRSPSSSPPLTPSFSTSIHSNIRVDRSQSKVDLSEVAGLALQDPLTSYAGKSKQPKRTRLTADKNDQTLGEDIDVGILLATLPPSAHLPILLQVLRDNPSLSASILPQIPRPDLRSCINELECGLDRIRKLVGPIQSMYGLQTSVSSARRWERVRDEVETFCRTASTYIRYITSTSPGATAIDPQSLFALLHPLTTHLLFLLALIPSSSPFGNGIQSATPGNVVLELAKLILSKWNTWILELAAEVNDRGGMYPYSVVIQWADTLDHIVSGPSTSSSDQSIVPHWSSSSSTVQSPEPDSQSLQPSFREAFVPIRDQFLTRVGWLVGRSRSNFN
ncbi:hypothetical protein CI109_102196 [Kwoniella shandongensis]|uniref:Uncharacterized protein n=1 Tax=Kwoniella shandongensis TaxID=1734106 RepID=A0A5M6C234_9TREE|nr:uncharacterized protein CI109_003647 [Kwoniella shandongensis]KAA5527992.1 hypothetical protein CI109_003647 [Kwoniella shandongensis]